MTRGKLEDADFEDAGPSSQEGHRNHGEDVSRKGLRSSLRGTVRCSSGYFGVAEEKSKTIDPWKLYMTLPIPSACHEPGKKKSKLKFLGFFSSAEAAGHVHDQVAYHVLGRRRVQKYGINIT